MKTKTFLLLGAISGFLLSCTTQRVQVTGSYGSTEVPETGPTAAHFPHEAKREYWNTTRPVTRGYGAYAYLIFTADPRSIDRARCLNVCEAFNGYLTETSPTVSAPQKRAQMVTFWPLTTDYSGGAADCGQLIANYDRQFASRVAAHVADGKKQGRGPLLVAWTTPYGETDSNALVLDLSRFGTDDVGRAIQLWKARIARDPTIWQKGWKAVKVQEEIRNAVENVVPGVVTVVATFFRSKPESPKPE